ncbi:hypothetical protein ISF_07418 [Cordyceps fumosorosea ARSEF 2679]|uniref:Uncharacterized protein n=1 Tax=Cordyceps fumosorosea (strain ARSEF 2679) TaxID=1081104 RepID=A0A167PPW8_CORFA|nr:hypothetical protein ISF_07418 [Cordyceps fumosorosea ARSEF 2679]OAA56902.1 hypothetical protein ISF_07418 [Cordyceps fumosorosea ARSEF 2679]
MSLADAAPITAGDRLAQLDITDDSSRGTSTPRAALINPPSNPTPAAPADDDKPSSKGKKRALFGFGKKKPSSSPTGSPADAKPPLLTKSSSKMPGITHSTHSSRDYPLPSPASPSRALSASPRLSSPAGSQIFERDVQDSTVLKPNSPAIPTHIQTENYIPPVLDDASEAITNNKLDPDAVEIVTHSSHLPASVTVTGAPNSPNDHQSSTEWAAELASFADRIGVSGDTASNYGSLDSADVRRLSFISFADVVQSEHSASLRSPASRENIHLAGLTSLPSSALNRSPSPIRSPVSSQGLGTSPPTSNPGSMKGVEMSPPRKLMGSPKSTQHSLAAPSELNIETMRQALRRTGSTDLAGARSMPVSPIDGPGSR